MVEFFKYCPKCGNMLWVEEGKPDGYNMSDGKPLYSAKIYCARNTLFTTHYSNTVHKLTREEYNIIAASLLKIVVKL